MLAQRGDASFRELAICGPALDLSCPSVPYSLRGSGTPKSIVRIGKLHEALCRMLSVTYLNLNPKSLSEEALNTKRETRGADGFSRNGNLR